MNIYDALKLIAVRSPLAQREAVKALRSSGGAQQMRYNWLVDQALGDPQAELSDAEKCALIELIEPLGDDTRSHTLRVRLTEIEHADLQQRADAEMDGDMSKLVRRSLFG